MINHFGFTRIQNSILLSTTGDKILDLSKMKVFAANKMKVTQNFKFGLGRVQKHCGKRRKCWFPAFSPFS